MSPNLLVLTSTKRNLTVISFYVHLKSARLSSKYSELPKEMVNIN